jgi:hypothetical protein
MIEIRIIDIGCVRSPSVFRISAGCELPGPVRAGGRGGGVPGGSNNLGHLSG